MKISLKIAYSLFLVGFILKFFHIHFNAILMLIGLAGILIISLILFFSREKRFPALLNLAIWGWLLVLFASIKYLPVQTYVLIAASILSIPGIVLAIRKQKLSSLWTLGFCFIFAITFYLLPTDTRYKTLSISWNYEINTDYETWDKYSWFLYQNGNYDEALSASMQARAFANQLNAIEWVEFIDSHSTAIQERNWKKYR